MTHKSVITKLVWLKKYMGGKDPQYVLYVSSDTQPI